MELYSTKDDIILKKFMFRWVRFTLYMIRKPYPSTIYIKPRNYVYLRSMLLLLFRFTRHTRVGPLNSRTRQFFSVKSFKWYVNTFTSLEALKDKLIAKIDTREDKNKQKRRCKSRRCLICIVSYKIILIWVLLFILLVALLIILIYYIVHLIYYHIVLVYMCQKNAHPCLPSFWIFQVHTRICSLDLSVMSEA